MSFLDTSILVYGIDEDEPWKRSIAREIIDSGPIANDIVISTQILQEYFWTASR